jgi:microcystin degradation protein MlrC
MSQQKVVAPKRIAVGGMQHETNTFAPHLATLSAFERADSWPALTIGEPLFETMQGLNIPLSGFIESATQDGHHLHSLCWCSAEPCSYVTHEAFERVAEIICSSLREIDQLDAVYLDLHGAMVTEDHEDGEGELLRRVREIVGPSVPVVISLDLHANVTRGMLDDCDAMTIYRTYPHLDMAVSGARAYDLLLPLLRGKTLHKAMRKIPFLFPLTSQCTSFDPCKSIYDGLDGLGEAAGVTSVDFATGFPPADIAECGAAVVAYGEDADAAEAATEQVYQQVLAAEADFDVELLDPDTAVMRAMAIASNRPVVLADAQDNPGAGGTSDTTDLLAALVRNGARRAVIAVIYDPEVADAAHRAGVGAVLDTALGGKSGLDGIEPYAARFAVETLGDGRFTYTGAMNLNSKAQLGNMALLRVVDEDSEVRVVIGSSRSQCLDLAMIRHLGLEPTEQNIVAVKSTVHFRADFDPIAAETLVVIAPGIHPCKLDDLEYHNLRAGVRLGPLGKVHKS